MEQTHSHPQTQSFSDTVSLWTHLQVAYIQGYCIFSKHQRFGGLKGHMGRIEGELSPHRSLFSGLPDGPGVGAPYAPVRSDCHTAGSAGESDAAACPQQASAPPSACLSATPPPPGMTAAPAAERYTAWPPAPGSSAQAATYTTNTNTHT